MNDTTGDAATRDDTTGDAATRDSASRDAATTDAGGTAEPGALVLDGVTLRAGDEVLLEVTRTIPPGSVVLLHGPEAGTVSAALRALVTAITGAMARPGAPDGDGDVHVEGTVRVDGATPAALLVALTPREHGLVGDLTATENVELGVLARRRPGPDDEALVTAVFDDLDVPPSVRGNLAEQLSGGQQQRVAVARALVAGAPVIALDDPTSELDDRSSAAVGRAVRNAASRGAVVLVADAEAGVTGADVRLRIGGHGRHV